MIAYYILFCLATAISAALIIIYPALRMTKEQDEDNVMVNARIATYTVMVIIMAIFAPAIFYCMLTIKNTDDLITGITNAFLGEEDCN